MEETAIYPYFVLSCIVFANSTTGASKRFAFVDLSCPEATEVIIKAWHQKPMEKFLNQIECCHYDDAHQRLSAAERKREGKRSNLANLFVERLPYEITESQIRDVFSLYGEVVSIKLKKPVLYM